jgi:hypothetical protein
MAHQRLGDDERIGPARQLHGGERVSDPEELFEGAIERTLACTTAEDQRSVDVEKEESGCRQAAWPRTLPARGPFAEGSSSKLTCCPSLSWSKEPSSTELR